jgi:type I restriction enzyme S subunit
MRNKMKITAKEEQARPTLLPKLRFPEFREAEGWKGVPLSELVAALDAGVSVNSGDRPATGNEIGILKTSAVTNGIFEPQENKVVFDEAERERVKQPVQGGTIIISRMNTPALVGANAYVETGFKNLYLPDRLWAAKAKPDTSMRFLASILGSDKGRAALSKLAKGSSGSMKNITKPDVLAILVVAPSPAEQQKIADCLSSVDELIAAQARKVDALKTHKKGLMQQLFPREGEAQPRLRFPEFENAGEWVSGSLGNFFETTSGGTPSRTEKAYWNGDIPWITTTLVDCRVISAADEFITAEGLKNSSAKLFPKGTVLLAMYGQGKTRGQVALLGIEAATNQACAAILPQNGIDPYFVFAYLAGRYDEIREISNSGGQENLSQGLVRKIHIAIPPDDAEQRKVTTLVNNLDGLISAEFDRLEALKFHKKGLMHQLFPSLESKT